MNSFTDKSNTPPSRRPKESFQQVFRNEDWMQALKVTILWAGFVAWTSWGIVDQYLKHFASPFANLDDAIGFIAIIFIDSPLFFMLYWLYSSPRAKQLLVESTGKIRVVYRYLVRSLVWEGSLSDIDRVCVGAVECEGGVFSYVIRLILSDGWAFDLEPETAHRAVTVKEAEELRFKLGMSTPVTVEPYEPGDVTEAYKLASKRMRRQGAA